MAEGLFLNANELKEMEETAQKWAKSPNEMKVWAEGRARMYLLVLDKIITKSGGRRAAQDMSVALDRQIKLMDSMARAGLFGNVQLPASQQLDQGEDFSEAELLVAEGKK